MTSSSQTVPAASRSSPEVHPRLPNVAVEAPDAPCMPVPTTEDVPLGPYRILKGEAPNMYIRYCTVFRNTINGSETPYLNPGGPLLVGDMWWLPSSDLGARTILGDRRMMVFHQDGWIPMDPESLTALGYSVPEAAAPAPDGAL
jgi:hypothetical protein